MAAGQPDKFRVGAIIQARMQSTRLPGKIMLPLPFGSEDVLLSWPIQRLKGSKLISTIVLATSVNQENTCLKNFADEQNIFFYEGSEDNVLSRFVEAANIHELDVIVRITGDNPIIDEKLIDRLVELHINGNFDYSYSINLPIGMNVEVVKAKALLEISNKADLNQSDEEHVTLFFKRHDSYNVLQHDFKLDIGKDLRLTVDYPADYAMVNIAAEVSKKNNLFGIDLIVFLKDNYPWFFNINAHLHQKKHYNSLEQELTDAFVTLQFHEFNYTIDFLKHQLNEA